jgi:8-oxo-dGTP pyrophosphatase MutT (NUDIX family)
METISQRLRRTGLALQQALAEHEPRLVEAPGARPASVLMPLWEHDDLVRVVFTKRNGSLPHHAGQISFPGGMAEADDPDSSYTALRETYEEIGVRPDEVEVVAQLDQVRTVTDFLVTPYVGLLPRETVFRTNPHEVDQLVVVPLSKVLDRERYRSTEINWNGLTFQQPALRHEGEIIWGATGRMLLNLLEVLGNRATEVIQAAN